jgi:hypothetical protein
MKKSILVSAIALALSGGNAVLAETSTVDGRFIVDYNVNTETSQFDVKAGSIVNLSVMGLNAAGEVDAEGEALGAILYVRVTSEIGEVKVGANNPNNLDMSDPSIGAGNFAGATSVKYVRLDKGLGQVNISYPADVQGSDNVRISLQQRYSEGGSLIDKEIASTEKTFNVLPADKNIASLDITAFMPSPKEKDAAGNYLSTGSFDGYVAKSDDDETDGVNGRMTAGKDGAQITVQGSTSLGENAAGDIVVQLLSMTSVADREVVYEYEAKLVDGAVTVTLDQDGQDVVKAGAYYIEAKTPGGEVTSVDMLNADTLEVLSTGQPNKLAMTSSKDVVSESDTTGTDLNVYVLDEYGNMTSPITNWSDPIVILKDTNGTVVDGREVLFEKEAKKTYNLAGENFRNTGVTSLVASVKPGQSTAISIADSDPLVFKVVEKHLAVTPLKTDAATAGSKFDAFNVTINGEDATKDPGSLVIKSLSSTGMAIETRNVNRIAGSTTVQGYFETENTSKRYLVGDKAGTYGQVFVNAFAIDPATATQVAMVDAHGYEKTSVAAADNDDYEDRKVAKLYEVSFKMMDTYGNAITDKNADGQVTQDETGTITLSSSNAEDIKYVGTGVSSAGIPGREGGEMYIVYNPEKFAGEDAITANFSEPGLSSGEDTMTITTTVGALAELSEIGVHVEQTNIPVNGEVAVRVTLDASYTPGVNVTFNGNSDEFGDAEVLNPKVTVLDGAQLTSGQSILKEGTRQILVINAGPKEGKFSLTFANANGSVTNTVNFEVTAKLEEPQAECSNANPELCTTEAACQDADGVFFSGITNDVEDGCYGFESGVVAQAMAIDTNASKSQPAASFKGGVLVDGKFTSMATVSVEELKDVTLAYSFAPVKEDVGKKAQMLAVIGGEFPDGGPYDGGADTIYFAFSEFVGNIYPIDLYAPTAEAWKAEVDKMIKEPYSNATLKAKESIILVPGDLAPIGEALVASNIDSAQAYLFLGYIIDSAETPKIVYNNSPIILTIQPGE